MTEFRFSNDHTAAQVSGIIDVLRKPRLWIPTEKDYPGHGAWLEKVEAQIADGTKHAMVAYCAGQAIGTVIYQRHPQEPTLLEVRNISVTPEAGGRYVGSFLLRNSEIEAAANDFTGVEKVVIDTKQNNTGMVKFLLDHGYELQRVTDLYGSGTGRDAILEKSLT